MCFTLKRRYFLLWVTRLCQRAGAGAGARVGKEAGRHRAPVHGPGNRGGKSNNLCVLHTAVHAHGSVADRLAVAGNTRRRRAVAAEPLVGAGLEGGVDDEEAAEAGGSVMRRVEEHDEFLSTCSPRWWVPVEEYSFPARTLSICISATVSGGKSSECVEASCCAFLHWLLLVAGVQSQGSWVSPIL